MAINTPPDIASPGGVAALPVPFSAVLWARDIENQGNLAPVSLPASRSLFVYVRTSAPIILATFFSAGGSPLIHVLHRSRSPHVFQYERPIDHVLVSLSSLPANLGQIGALNLPREGSSLSYPNSSTAVRGDGYVLLSGIDIAASYSSPPLDTSPRFVSHYAGSVAALTQILVNGGTFFSLVRSITRIDLFNNGTPGSSAALRFDIDGYEQGPISNTNQVSGTLEGFDLWALAPGQAESVDYDFPPGAEVQITVENDNATLAGSYVISLWGY